MIPIIYDAQDGIDLVFDFGNGLSIQVSMDDNSARQLVNIIDNKLNGHGK